MGKLNLKPGDKFGHLKYIRDAKKKILPSGQKPRVARCRCDCGKVKNVLVLHLTRMRITHCGCEGHVKHGDLKTHLHNMWRGMRNRCSPTYFQKQYYFDKGITVCPEWNKYVNFKKWALANGYKDDLQIDRKKNHLGYYPGNCHFVTQEINLANRDITIKVIYKNKERPLSLICKELGYNERRYDLILRRLKRGWQPERAIELPARNGNYQKGRKQNGV